MNTILQTSRLITPLETIINGAIVWNDSRRIIFSGYSKDAENIQGNRMGYPNGITQSGCCDWCTK